MNTVSSLLSSFFLQETQTLSPHSITEDTDPPDSAGSGDCGLAQRKGIRQPDDALVQTACDAKEIEWQQVFSAMQSAFYEWVDTFTFSEGTITIDTLLQAVRESVTTSPKTQFEERLTRFFMSWAKRSSLSIPQEHLSRIVPMMIARLQGLEHGTLYDKLEDLAKQVFDHYGIPLDRMSLRDHFCIELTDLAYTFQNLVQDHEKFTRKNDKLYAYVETCIRMLSHDISSNPTDAKPLAILALYKMRDALETKAYNLYKTNEHHPLVHLLHLLSQSLYASTHVVPGYTHLGDAIYSKKLLSEISPLQFALSKTWSIAAQHGIAKDDPKNKDSFWSRVSKSTRRILDSTVDPITFELALSNGWRSFIGLAAQFKDHHGLHDNNPGVLWDEVVRSQEKISRIKTVISASPAYGKTIVPEFLGLLQGIENSYFYKMAGPYHKVAYTNLQSKKGPVEGVQTEALMHLNKLYPYSFKGITLSQEPFEETKLSKKVVNKLYKQLTSHDSFSLTAKPGYYFPTEDADSWKRALRKIVDVSYSYFTQKKTARSVTAYIELVHLGIVRYHEMRTLLTAQDRARPQTISMRICQAGVDRAGKINGQFLWVLEPTNTTALINSIVFGRAVLAKGRLPVPEKLRQFEALVAHVDKPQLKEYLSYIDSLATTHKLTSHSIHILRGQ